MRRLTNSQIHHHLPVQHTTKKQKGDWQDRNPPEEGGGGKKKKKKFKPKFGTSRNWPKHPKIGRNLIRGEMRGIMVLVFMPIRNIPIVLVGTKRNQ